MKILFYIILFAIAYRALKKLFSPALDNVNHQQQNSTQTHQSHTTYRSSTSDRSNIVEDIDYEEVE
ncbi:MAG: hypothetical protein R2730_00930 [Chitinophagales bacterium]